MESSAYHELTQRYARFARSAAGVGHVIGGVLALAAYFGGALLPLTVWSRLALAAAPLLWIASKEVLRRRFYRRHGRMGSRTDTARGWHIAFTVIVAAVSLGVTVVVVLRILDRPPGVGEGFPLFGYLAFALAMPFLVWFFMWTVEEFIIGVFLLSQAAVLLTGGESYPLGTQLQAPVFGVVAIVLGIKQHRDYRSLRADIQALRTRDA